MPDASPDPRGALRAWFIGPRAENAALVERLVTEALRDHVFWRRNYHPEDGFTIRETDKRAEGYEAAVATLTGPAAPAAGHLTGLGVFAQDWPSLDAIAELTAAGGHDDLTPLYMREADAVASRRGIISLSDAG